MNIILAKTAGFCFGVKRAVDMAFDGKYQEVTHTIGPIIHNETVIKRLEAKGIHAVDSIDGVDEGTVIIRAHGVGKHVYDEAKSKSIEVVDATCPFVTKIHKLVVDYKQKSYEIIVIGDEAHPEIIGIDGWSGNTSIIIKDSKHIPYDQLDFSKKYLVVSQTTYKKEVVDEVLNALEDKGYDLNYEHTICTATKKRQEEAREISKTVDAMIVIGSPFSSNTQKLYEICKQHCEHTYCIEDEKALNLDNLTKHMIIGVTAGASTPSDVIYAVVEKLKTLEIN